jgi:hypothetical protein
MIDAGSSSRIGPATAGPILLQFWKENFGSASSLLNLENAREAAV